MKRVNILNLSDIHLGHNNTSTEFIIRNLVDFLKEHYNIIKDTNIMILSGDFFHKLLPNNSNDYKISIGCLVMLANFCKKHDIMLRVLEGTPSHDFGQLEVFSNILRDMDIDIDYKYFNTLAIEHINKYDMDLLYIPDEVNHDATITQEQILTLLRKHSLDKVDHVTMHGQFHYHLPIHSKASFSEDFILGITDNYIVCGHIHIFSTYDRIITPGSFDRLTHNEESKKGGVFISYTTYNKDYIFLENKNAKIYKTLTYADIEPDIIKKDINKLKLPKDSHIRIKSDKENNNKHIVKFHKEQFPHYNFKIEYNKETREIKEELKITFKELSITPENIKDLMLDKINIGKDISGINYNYLLEELSNVI
jgi:hypothetical protein